MQYQPMNKKIYPLLIAQFLSAFADNAILFTVIAMVMQSTSLAAWYIPALQSMFLIAFVIFAPWVGALADQHAKSYILIIANLIKAAGAALLLFEVEPLLAYAIVGTGAALYSPAKYGILPELAQHNLLVKANSWIEGSTILAILLGMVLGAQLADHSIRIALISIIVLFFLSALITLLIPGKSSRTEQSTWRFVQFGRNIKHFLATPRSRFAILGASMFWLAAATLRVILIAWAPLILLSKTASEIAQLTLFLAIGIIIGSALVPRIIPLEHIRRARIPAGLMAIFIMLLSATTNLWEARTALLIIGCAGGMFIVPINAALQEIGQRSIGSGSAVALQNFFQNVAMLIGVGCYTFASSLDIDPVISMLSLGIFTLLVTLLISYCLPDTKTIH
ncbi:MAG: MFS transporter, LPLT family, lysophospholipid transporter [Methyloprofundus sp.]|nr:MAG: MFS transporter, LPLT family, lysophospholipid transporter [Methyloprofundus sp.]